MPATPSGQRVCNGRKFYGFVGVGESYISDLLSQAGSAHHHFEQTVLKGVYDQEWPAWYAEYVIQHGLRALLPRPVTVEQLGRFLAENYEVYKRENSKLGWTDYTAQQIAANWSNGS